MICKYIIYIFIYIYICMLELIFETSSAKKYNAKHADRNCADALHWCSRVKVSRDSDARDELGVTSHYAHHTHTHTHMCQTYIHTILLLHTSLPPPSPLSPQGRAAATHPRRPNVPRPPRENQQRPVVVAAAERRRRTTPVVATTRRETLPAPPPPTTTNRLRT